MQKKGIIFIIIIALGLTSFTNSKKMCVSAFPKFYFKVNSTDYFDPDPFSKEAADKVFGGLLQADSLNPTLTFEIVGNADFQEKNPEQLSKKRAERIRTELIKRGANPNRWLTIGYGTSKPMFPLEKINSELDLDKRDTLHLYNRRTAFRFIAKTQTKEMKLREELLGK